MTGVHDPFHETIFLVDDDEDIRSALSRALRKRGYRVEAFASGEAFLEHYTPDRPGCLILDYGMPGMTGLEVQQRLNALRYPLPIIFITGHGGVPESVQAIKNGAVDFLEKPFRQTVLIERIETALALGRVKPAPVVEVEAKRLSLDRLTSREQEIVERILANPSAVSSKEIANDLGISPRTVDHHRARILEKLGVRNVTELVALGQRKA